MYFDVYADRKFRDVEQETWGHLAAKKGQSYKGYMIYAHSAYGDIVLIDAHFENLNDSPWLFESMQDFIAENGERGGLYRWSGYYKLLKKGNSCFDGFIQKIELQALKEVKE